MSVALSGASWLKSSYSQPSGECVEAAHLPHGRVGVRDSKHPSGPALVFGGTAWDAFTAALRAGRFDLPGR
ncbi:MULTISPECIES: DUF397 domain-containing protein [unclassified Nocardia]|uniref:DUF397 domain-containing protein n=1 Tax=unclassified Nocardia TaxID=2637762 RepID=UPI0024A7CD82|nr:MULTISPECIES: DUF397 domain-containing protein [unclassified Nocardia]